MSTESTLWMGDIQPWMNEDIIMKSFTLLGIKPKSIKMIKDKKLNLLKNFCFINFDSMIEANKALNQLKGKRLPNADINFRLNWANQNSEGNINLYVGNLAQNIEDIDLYNLFKSKYPSVHHASIVTEKGVSKGFGFVHFLDKEDYDKCLKEMDGYNFHHQAIRVKERKKKNEEEKNNNQIKNIIFKNNNRINLINNNDIKINLNKRKSNLKNNIDSNINEYNNYYKINNNYYMNNVNNFNKQQMNLNNIASFYPKRREEEDTSLESTFSSQEKVKDLSSSNSNSSIHKSRKFSDNIELLESDDFTGLNKKIQESVDKMFEHYKYYKGNNKSK